MTAHDLIYQARADGLELRSDDGKLKLRGHTSVVARWKPTLAEHKMEILAALSAPNSSASCQTCAHRPRGWLVIQDAPCGEPFLSGLSEVDGVIVYHGNGGADCPAWMATRRHA